MNPDKSTHRSSSSDIEQLKEEQAPAVTTTTNETPEEPERADSEPLGSEKCTNKCENVKRKCQSSLEEEEGKTAPTSVNNSSAKVSLENAHEFNIAEALGSDGGTMESESHDKKVDSAEVLSGPNLKNEEDKITRSIGDNLSSSPQAPTSTREATTPVVTPENLLSPPKSETQTDDTNTVTSSSPASNSQLSPKIEQEGSIQHNTSPVASDTSKNAPVVSDKKLDAHLVKPLAGKPINVVANGTIPNSGKPSMSAINKRVNKSMRTVRMRKPKTLVAMYESEISDNKIGIKLCIKKSEASSTGTTVVATSTAPAIKAPPVTSTKQNRKRSRKSKSKARVDSDDSEYESKKKKDRAPNNTADRQKKVSFSCSASEELREMVEQTAWGRNMPEEILFKIFQLAVEQEGCLPTLFRLGRVCSYWRRVSLSPKLWKSMDLSTRIKEKYRSELKLKWFIDNRCSACTDLNVSNWKVSDINCFLHKLAQGAPNLEGITLFGWKNFTSDHLSYLADNLLKLQRIDLSSINVEMNASKSAVGLQSLCNALQKINGRLTHLYLAHNRLAGIPQIVNTLSSHCPNLVLLDLSNVTTQATSHGILHIEKLQNSCRKLKVLRVTNSHVTLSTTSMQETLDSPGFPDLEELSVAALTDESRVIGDEHLQRMLKTSSKLKLLDVRGCTRLTHESLIRLPAWDIKHLFLSGCSVTRDVGSGLELIASKWAHSLIELDLAWANVQQPIDNALRALAEKGSESPLAHLNLCGSSVSEEAVKDILANCTHMSSINLSSCRGLPRGVKRLMQGPQELQELRDVLKVQLKFKLPLEPKQEKKEDESTNINEIGSTNSETN